MSRRKMSVSSVLGDACKRMTRKMTIHDPSAISSLIQSLNPTVQALSVDDPCRARASSMPPSLRITDHGTHPTYCEEEEEDPHQQHEEDDQPSEDLSSDGGDEFMEEYLRELCEGE